MSYVVVVVFKFNFCYYILSCFFERYQGNKFIYGENLKFYDGCFPWQSIANNLGDLCIADVLHVANNRLALLMN